MASSDAGMAAAIGFLNSTGSTQASGARTPFSSMDPSRSMEAKTAGRSRSGRPYLTSTREEAGPDVHLGMSRLEEANLPKNGPYCCS